MDGNLNVDDIIDDDDQSTDDDNGDKNQNDDELTDDDKDYLNNDDDNGDDDSGDVASENKKLLEEVKSLRKKKSQLNKALHQARQKNKQTNSDEPVNYSDEDLVGLVDRYKDDPAALLQIMRFVGTQSAKQQTDFANLEKVKQNHDAYVVDRWPEMADEDSELYQQANETKQALKLEDHPLGDYIALSTLICEALPDLQKVSYDQGVNDAKKGTVKANRQIETNIQKNKLTPSHKENVGGESMSAISRKVAKQMNLTKRQIALMKKIKKTGR